MKEEEIKLTDEQKKYYIDNYGYEGYIAFITTGVCKWKNACLEYYTKGIKKAIELERRRVEELGDGDKNR